MFVVDYDGCDGVPEIKLSGSKLPHSKDRITQAV
jgi:hypothetical protein